jgi:hypothetical protein
MSELSMIKKRLIFCLLPLTARTADAGEPIAAPVQDHELEQTYGVESLVKAIRQVTR